MDEAVSKVNALVIFTDFETAVSKLRSLHAPICKYGEVDVGLVEEGMSPTLCKMLTRDSAVTLPIDP